MITAIVGGVILATFGVMFYLDDRAGGETYWPDPSASRPLLVGIANDLSNHWTLSLTLSLMMKNSMLSIGELSLMKWLTRSGRQMMKMI
jgi:hypothetical protein